MGVIHVRLPLANSRRYPPGQIFRIAFDVGREIEQLLGSIRQQALSLLARHVSGSLDVPHSCERFASVPLPFIMTMKFAPR